VEKEEDNIVLTIKDSTKTNKELIVDIENIDCNRVQPVEAFYSLSCLCEIGFGLFIDDIFDGDSVTKSANMLAQRLKAKILEALNEGN